MPKCARSLQCACTATRHLPASLWHAAHATRRADRGAVYGWAQAILVASAPIPEGTETIKGYDFNSGLDYDVRQHAHTAEPEAQHVGATPHGTRHTAPPGRG